jgi:hypothetical protein
LNSASPHQHATLFTTHCPDSQSPASGGQIPRHDPPGPILLATDARMAEPPVRRAPGASPEHRESYPSHPMTPIRIRVGPDTPTPPLHHSTTPLLRTQTNPFDASVRHPRGGHTLFHDFPANIRHGPPARAHATPPPVHGWSRRGRVRSNHPSCHVGFRADVNTGAGCRPRSPGSCSSSQRSARTHRSPAAGECGRPHGRTS